MSPDVAIDILLNLGFGALLVVWFAFWWWLAERLFDIVYQPWRHALTVFGGTFSPLIVIVLWAIWTLIR